MFIHGFIEKYCKDLIIKKSQAKSFFIDDTYPNDDIIPDDDGNLVPVVYIDANPVPVQDFFGMDKADFIHAYNYPSAAREYDNYLQNFEILEGPEALAITRNRIAAEIRRLELGEQDEALVPVW